MWETSRGGCSESSIPILTRAVTFLKSALHIYLLSKASLKQSVPTAKTIRSALEAHSKGFIPHEPFFFPHLSTHATNILQRARQSQNAFQSPSATS